MASSVPAPSIWFPFSSFSPFHTSFFFFSFMSSLASCTVISLLSFFCVHTARPLVCTCTTYLQIRFQVAQVFTMRWVVIGCSCALGSFSLQPHTHTHTLLSRLVSSSCLHSFVLLRAHSHFCPDLSASRLPWGRRVCVCVSPPVSKGSTFVTKSV